MAIDAQLSEGSDGCSLHGLPAEVGACGRALDDEDVLGMVFDNIAPETDGVGYANALVNLPDEAIVQMIRDLIDRRSYGRSIYQTRSLTPRRRR